VNQYSVHLCVNQLLERHYFSSVMLELIAFVLFQLATLTSNPSAVATPYDSTIQSSSVGNEHGTGGWTGVDGDHGTGGWTGVAGEHGTGGWTGR
jgi:hypothetical protein